MSILYLPPETLDHIVDLLHDEPETLKACCLVSKPWIPRTRRHLFAEVVFNFPEHIEFWKKTFPDPSNSPAYHTHTMFVRCTQLVMMADDRAGGLIQTFPRVVRLRLSWLSMDGDRRATADDLEKHSLIPFHKFWSTLKSLHVASLFLPYRQIFNLVLSSPLLEDLAMFGRSLSSSDDGDFRGSQTTQFL